MRTSPHRDRERAEDEAAAWLVRLAEAPDDAGLRARFEAWRAQSRLNAEMWARTSRAYDLVGKGPPSHREHWAAYAAGRAERALPPARVTVATGPGATGRTRPATRFAARRLAVGIAAGGLAACLAIAVLPGVMLRLEADVATGTAEVHSTVLEDGTRVRLAPDSALDIAFADGERRVRLLKGQAFFEVAPDAARPFRVAAGGTVATVLGTAFEMRLADDGAAVAVRHGQVRVDDDSTAPPTSETLQAGDCVRVTWHGGARRGNAPPDEIADWLRGELIARNRPAGDIVDALRRYYGGAIVVQSSTFADRRVSGIYDLRDPVRTLRDLAASHGATVRQISPWLLIVTSG
jgi:transmembrane sensor